MLKKWPIFNNQPWFSNRIIRLIVCKTKDPFILIIFFMTLGSWALGWHYLGVVPTDPPAESQAVNDAFHIFNDNHSFGIYQYTHYPNGPSYILLPFIPLGFTNDFYSLRFIPLTIASLSFGAMLAYLLLNSSTIWSRWWVIAIGISLLSQPSFYAWQGALHEQSYALSITFLLIAYCSIERRFWPWLLALFGFISGWIGYDFLPPQFFSIFTIRLAKYHQYSCLDFSKKLIHSIRDSFIFGLGALYAIFSHLIQNWLYFADIKIAVSDLFGSAVLRMGIEEEIKFLSAYPGQESFIGTYNPIDISVSLLQSFLFGAVPPWGIGGIYNGPHKWANKTVLSLTIFFSLIISGIIIYKRMKREISFRRSFLPILISLIIGCIASSVSWFFIMPHHAACHFIFLPRHFLVGFIILVIVPLLFSRSGDFPLYTSNSLIKVFNPVLVAFFPIFLIALVITCFFIS